jgi:cytochrome c oxidase subunit 4
MQPRTYFAVFAALIALTVLTVGLDLVVRENLVNLGTVQHPFALAIAAAKASLVILFFMHLWYSRPIVRLVAVGSMLWLAILLTYTLTDYLSRTWMHVARSVHDDHRAAIEDVHELVHGIDRGDIPVHHDQECSDT